MNDVTLELNGEQVAARVEGRLSLADFVREHQLLTGTHLACEHGVCGACTVLVDDLPARGCLTLAAAVDGARIRTIEGFEDDPLMAIIRQAFADAHGLQCGYCTPGMLITVYDMLRRGAAGDRRRIRLELAGNICRCTGYAGILAAVELAAQRAKS